MQHRPTKAGGEEGRAERVVNRYEGLETNPRCQVVV